MDFRFSEAEEAYRAEVRDWLADHTPAWWQSAGAGDLGGQDEHFEDLRAWHRQLYEAGYVGTAK